MGGYIPRSDTKALKLRGGAVTVIDKALLPLGAFSMVQNLRPTRPGFKKRPGQIKLHTTADGTNQVVTLYQFNKNRVSDTHFFAQMGDGDVLEATNDPPTVTTGVFGTEVFSGSAGQIPASWSTIDDMMLYSNGVDQHQIYAGSGSYVDGFVVYKGAAAIPDVPEIGEDYSIEVSDGDPTTVAVLDSLDTLANFNAIFIKTLVPAKSITPTMASVNSKISALTVDYWNGAWTAVSGLNDGTSVLTGTQFQFDIEIDSTNIDSDLTNFPVRLHLSSSSGLTNFNCVDFFANVSYANRKKISVKDSLNNELFVEIDADSAAFTAGDINLWVKVPTVTSASPTTLTLNYNPAQPENTTYVGDTGSIAAENVWDSNFLAVWHLGQDPSGTAPQMIDSTSNSKDGTTQGTMTSDDLVSSQITYGLDFEGTDDRVEFSATNPASYTLEALVNVDIADQSDGVVCINGSEAIVNHANNWSLISGNTTVATGSAVTTGSYLDLAATKTGTTYDIFENGVSVLTTLNPGPGWVFNVPNAIAVGHSGRILDGKVDEVRISDVVRSDAWIKGTHYSNADNLVTYVGTGNSTLGQTGAISFTEPTDIIPKYLYGTNGFWYRLTVSAVLDTEVEISSTTFDSSWQDIINMWDSVLVESIEVQVEGTSTYSVFGSSSVNLNAVTANKKIMISCADPIVGLYIDVGLTPNATGTVISDIKYWNGTAMVSVGTVNDGTSGLSNSGFVTFGRQAAIQPLQFNSSQYYAFWYELTLDTATSADMVVSFEYMPYFNIAELGKGVCNTVWKERAIYAFDRFGEFLHVTKEGEPLVLNGTDFGILKAGDGRSNQIVSMRRFHNELMVWQEEKGVEGGCLTLFEGYSPATFGKLLLSSKIGTMSDKTVEIIDGVLTSTATDESIKTLAFFLSQYGVCASDGRTITIISDDIQNYFDPLKDESIRRGYENQMWLKYDSAFNILRIGLVSGSSATVPNVFPIFDLTDKVWYFDVLTQELSCMVEVEAKSGDVPIVQLGGGVDDGQIYRLNTGTNDVSTAIDGYLIMEVSNDGFVINLNELLLRMKVQPAGNATVTITQNELTGSTLTLAMTAEVVNELVRRHRENVSITNQHISIKIQNATASQEMYIYDIGLGIDLWEGR